MNEVLFRQAIFLDNKFHHWHYWGLLDGTFIGIDTGICSPTKAIKNSQRFTGLVDKNKVRIYEGDIVRFETSYEFDRDDYSGETEVIWRENEAGFYPFTLNNRWRCDVENLEIIGNIYESKDLLDMKGETDGT